MARKLGIKDWRRISTGAMLAMLVIIAAALLPATAVADEQPSRMEALQLIRAGNDAYDAGDFETAYENYIAAHAILPQPIIRYRMGQSAQELGQIRDAVHHFDLYLEEGDDEEIIARIEEFLPELREQVPALLVIASEPAGAHVILIGEHEQLGEHERVLGQTPGEFDIPPGEARVALRQDGHGEETWTETVEPDGRYEWEVELRAISERDTGVAVIEDRVDARDSESMAMWGWTSAGLGVALLATGGVFSYLQYEATQTVNDYEKRGEGASREELQGLKDDATGYHRAALSTYIAGGVLAAAGVGILVYDHMRTTDDQALSLEGGFLPGGGFVGISGRF